MQCAEPDMTIFMRHGVKPWTVMPRIVDLPCPKYAVWGCAAVKAPEHSTPVVTLPASGWYAGQRVYYITTEITDPTMARNAGLTYTPRLRDAIPDYPKPPETRSVLERVYRFPSGDQDAVFASAPTPPGPASSDMVYSPLWLAYMVRWK